MFIRAVFFSLQFASFLFNNGNHESMGNSLSSAASYCFAFRGVCSLAVILLTNRNDLRWSDLSLIVEPSQMQQDSIILAVEEGISMKPHLNSALRAEILYFTTQGIIFSARQFYKLPDSSHLLESTGDDNEGNVVGTRDSSFSFKDKLHFGYISYVFLFCCIHVDVILNLLLFIVLIL